MPFFVYAKSKAVDARAVLNVKVSNPYMMHPDSQMCPICKLSIGKRNQWMKYGNEPVTLTLQSRVNQYPGVHHYESPVKQFLEAESQATVILTILQSVDIGTGPLGGRTTWTCREL